MTRTPLHCFLDPAPQCAVAVRRSRRAPGAAVRRRMPCGGGCRPAADRAGARATKRWQGLERLHRPDRAREVSRPPARPSSPDQTPGGGWSAIRCRLGMGERQTCARGPTVQVGSVCALVTIDASADARVLRRGGGTGRPGRPGRMPSQRCELGRAVSMALRTRLAQGPRLGGATGDRQGEHAFVKLGSGRTETASCKGSCSRSSRNPAVRPRPTGKWCREGSVGSRSWAPRTPIACASPTAIATPRASSSTPTTSSSTTSP